MKHVTLPRAPWDAPVERPIKKPRYAQRYPSGTLFMEKYADRGQIDDLAFCLKLKELPEAKPFVSSILRAVLFQNKSVWRFSAGGKQFDMALKAINQEVAALKSCGTVLHLLYRAQCEDNHSDPLSKDTREHPSKKRHPNRDTVKI